MKYNKIASIINYLFQVVDIENTDVPENVECAGDSVKKGDFSLKPH